MWPFKKKQASAPEPQTTLTMGTALLWDRMYDALNHALPPDLPPAQEMKTMRVVGEHDNALELRTWDGRWLAEVQYDKSTRRIYWITRELVPEDDTYVR